MPRFDFVKNFCKNPPMAERMIPELSKLLDEKDRARLFNFGGIIFHKKDGDIAVIPNADIEVEIQPPDSQKWKPVELRRWSPSNETQLILIAGNFGQGAGGKNKQAISRRTDYSNKDAPLNQGYPSSAGHRGGLRQATSRPILMKLMSQSYKLRKYR